MPTLYDLVWDSGPPMGRTVAVAHLERGGTVVIPERCPAIILFPAFFTPGLFFPSDPDLEGYFEVLIATPGGFTLTPAVVNRRLKVVRGLGWTRRVPSGPLFAATEGRIHVESVEPDGNGILATHSQFQGIVHRQATRHHPSTFDRYWAVRVHADAFATAPTADGGTGDEVDDPQDQAIARLFASRNGPSFRDPRTCLIATGTIYPERPVPASPIHAHHPIAVYPAGQRVLSTVAHVTDLHLNMRQDILAQTNARVIECPGAEDLSPQIGALVHRYSRSTLGILRALPAETDAVVVGGDLVDHIRNATLVPGGQIPVNAAAVWNAVSMASPLYEQHYQAGPDFIAAFSLFRRVCQARQIPFIGVTGNHDAYVEGYGISPRVSNTRQWRKLANEGIAADHNLTLYEAILAFGPTYADYRGVRGTSGTLWEGSSNFDAGWFDWFHTVFTPFSDFMIRVPGQRLVCLGWGNGERMIGAPDGQGIGHLPRATNAVTAAQEALLTQGFSSDRRTLLASHFTLASFGESIAEAPRERPQGRIAFRSGYGDFDYGTFEQRRTEVYVRVSTHEQSMGAVLTGHSHRKAVYLLDCDSPQRATATMIGLAEGSIRRVDLPAPMRERTAVVLSDSSGPLPRSNVRGEFGAWGSDSASGSVLRFEPSGRLGTVEVVRGGGQAAVKPRAVVSLEYLHYQEDAVWDGAVLEFQTTRRDQRPARSPAFWITLRRRWDQLGLAVKRVAFVSRLVTARDEVRWVRIEGESAGDDWTDVGRRVRVDGVETARRFPLWRVPAAEEDSFRDWTSVGTAADRFLALQFTADGSGDSGLIERYNWDSWWTFEVVAERDRRMPRYAERWTVRALAGGWFGDETSSDRPVVDQPDFGFRRRAFPGKYRRARHGPERLRR